MSKPKITILIPSISQSTDSFKELVSTLLLSLYEVRPHTGLQATYQLSRRLNMINLPTQLIWYELTRKLVTPPTIGGKNVNNVFLKAKANYTKFQQPTTKSGWFELVWLQIRTRTQKKVWKKTSLLRAPRYPSRSDETLSNSTDTHIWLPIWFMDLYTDILLLPNSIETHTNLCQTQPTYIYLTYQLVYAPIYRL